MEKVSWGELEQRDIKGKVLLLPTDTVWGLHAGVDDASAQARIVALKRRDTGKGFIILISKLAQIAQFGVMVTENLRTLLHKVWPGRVTVVMNCDVPKKYRALSTDGTTLAFRVPASRKLRNLIAHTGPLVSTSANISGSTQALTPQNIPVEIASKIDYFVNSHKSLATASTIIKVLR